eukprot:scaffold2722_cov75-Cyclotella_meneghiniana.AAC.1
MSSPNRNTIIQTTFQQVSDLIRTSPPIDDTGTKIHVPDSVRLKLYGYYKVATTPPTEDSPTNASRPSIFDVVGRAKYDAWQSCSRECRDAYEAMQRYVEVAASQGGGNLVGSECRRMYLEMLEKLEGANTMYEVVGVDDNEDGKNKGYDDSQLLPAPHEIVNQTPETEASKIHVISAYFNSFLPTPLLPRGQLDISILDLMYVIFQCLQHAMYYMCFSGPIYNITYSIMPSFINTCVSLIFGSFHPIQRGRWFESEIVERIQTHFNEADSQVVVGLSVRSLLDLYLSVRSFPVGSEVIIVPGISIQGMVDVMKYHHLKLVPIDLPENDAPEKDSTDDNICNPKWGVDVEAVKSAISKHTVAILVVHPFGALIASDDVMKRLRKVANDNSLEIWEDCAQCFTGTSVGSKFADISFLSFGPIKTGTALGGGLAVLRSTAAVDGVINKEQHTRMVEYPETMKRIQERMYKQHSNFSFSIRVVKCTILNLLSYSHLGCGAVKRIIEFIGYDYGEFVVSSLRGFCANNNTELMKQLRQRPSSALLALMYRRLAYSDATMRAAIDRKRRCRSFETHLVEKDKSHHLVPRHSSGSSMNGWIFPLLVRNPQHTSNVLLNNGIDAPCGLTQLKPVSMTRCPRISAVFDHILYLPVTSTSFGSSDQHQLIRVLREGIVEKKMVEKNQRPPFTIILAIICQWYFIDRRYLSMKLILGITLGLVRWIFFTASCGMVMMVLLRSYMGQIYLKSSNTFAKYSDMIFKSPVDTNASSNKIDARFQQSQTVLELDSTEIPLARFNKDVCRMCLVTGATGFIGSLLLRELLLHRKSLGIDCVIVIIRAKRGKSAKERATKLLEQRIFDCLSQDEKSSLVHVIEGDVTVKDCGLTKQQLASLCDMNISHVFHCAAAVSFQQPLEQAAMSNITSSLQMQKLTKRICNKATFVYISTAFVHGGNTGTKSNPLPESLFSLHPYDPLELYKSMLGSQSYASAALNELGFPNTYTFSKCICEHLLHADQGVKTVIVRPSIVGPSVQEPYEGWAGEK